MIGRSRHRLFIAILLALAALGAMPAAGQALRMVATAEELAAAVREVRPGETIVLAPGTYVLGQINVTTAGDRDHPITVRSLQPGEARLRSTAVELFKVFAPYWVFEGLDIACSHHGGCEHAFHIVKQADFTVIRNNRLHDFDASIKGNGEGGSFPASVRIEGNLLFNSAIRETAAPAHPIDVVGGTDWIIHGNLIADFGSADAPSYGAFLKGHSSRGVIENNLVICQMKLRSPRQTVGLSFGGGGTGAAMCQGGDCAVEHEGGIMRNNIIMNCPTEVGIYLNRAHDTQILNNTLYNTYGIQARFPTTTAIIRNNIIAGGIRAHDGAMTSNEDNLTAGNRWSPLLPSALRFLKSKIEGITRKYPNWTPFTRQQGERWVDWGEDWLAGTWMMRGTNGIDGLFTYPALARFDLAPQRSLPTAAGSPLVTEDFCGTPRLAARQAAGAVEPATQECALPRRLLESYLGYRDPDPGP